MNSLVKYDISKLLIIKIYGNDHYFIVKRIESNENNRLGEELFNKEFYIEIKDSRPKVATGDGQYYLISECDTIYPYIKKKERDKGKISYNRLLNIYIEINEKENLDIKKLKKKKI